MARISKPQAFALASALAVIACAPPTSPLSDSTRFTPTSRVAQPAPPESARYRPFVEPTLRDWRGVNATVGEVGGHMGAIEAESGAEEGGKAP